MSSNFLNTALFLLPVLLTTSCWIVFKIAAKEFGTKIGYFTGFLFYWIIWCLLVPVLLFGSDKILKFFKPSPVLDYKIIFCLVTLPIFFFLYAFPAALKKATALIIFLSLVLALANAFFEEVLWRAV